MTKRWGALALAMAPLIGAWAQGADDAEEMAQGESNAATCVERALEETSLSEHESTLLCQGARSAEPVDCFLQASENTFLEKHQILTLCSPALSEGDPDLL